MPKLPDLCKSLQDKVQQSVRSAHQRITRYEFQRDTAQGKDDGESSCVLLNVTSGLEDIVDNPESVDMYSVCPQGRRVHVVDSELIVSNFSEDQQNQTMLLHSQDVELDKQDGGLQVTQLDIQEDQKYSEAKMSKEQDVQAVQIETPECRKDRISDSKSQDVDVLKFYEAEVEEEVIDLRNQQDQSLDGANSKVKQISEAQEDQYGYGVQSIQMKNPEGKKDQVSKSNVQDVDVLKTQPQEHVGKEVINPQNQQDQSFDSGDSKVKQVSESQEDQQVRATGIETSECKNDQISDFTSQDVDVLKVYQDQVEEEVVNLQIQQDPSLDSKVKQVSDVQEDRTVRFDSHVTKVTITLDSQHDQKDNHSSETDIKITDTTQKDQQADNHDSKVIYVPELQKDQHVDFASEVKILPLSQYDQEDSESSETELVKVTDIPKDQQKISADSKFTNIVKTQEDQHVPADSKVIPLSEIHESDSSSTDSSDSESSIIDKTEDQNISVKDSQEQVVSKGQDDTLKVDSEETKDTKVNDQSTAPQELQETKVVPDVEKVQTVTCQEAEDTNAITASTSHTVTSDIHFKQVATVVPADPFYPDEDAQMLKQAMKGLGTDEKAIIEVLSQRTNIQRLKIAESFKAQFGSDLVDELKSELSGNFEHVIVALMTPLPVYLAQQLHDAVCGAGTREGDLIEIMCTRNNEEIREIKEAYENLYEKSLEEDLASDTSGCFRKLLVSLTTAARDEALFDPSQARQDAEDLMQAGVEKWGTDESTFNAILCTRSYEHLLLVFQEYEEMAGHSIEEAIDKEMSGDIQEGMLAIVQSVKNKPAYFAKRIHKAVCGAGTKDHALIRLITTRCEIDMVEIRDEYEKEYGETLVDAIKGDTSGDYKRILVALVGGE